MQTRSGRRGNFPSQELCTAPSSKAGARKGPESEEFLQL